MKISIGNLSALGNTFRLAFKSSTLQGGPINPKEMLFLCTENRTEIFVPSQNGLSLEAMKNSLFAALLAHGFCVELSPFDHLISRIQLQKDVHHSVLKEVFDECGISDVIVSSFGGQMPLLKDFRSLFAKFHGASSDWDPEDPLPVDPWQGNSFDLTMNFEVLDPQCVLLFNFEYLRVQDDPRDQVDFSVRPLFGMMGSGFGSIAINNLPPLFRELGVRCIDIYSSWKHFLLASIEGLGDLDEVPTSRRCLMKRIEGLQTTVKNMKKRIHGNRYSCQFRVEMNVSIANPFNFHVEGYPNLFKFFDISTLDSLLGIRNLTSQLSNILGRRIRIVRFTRLDVLGNIESRMKELLKADSHQISDKDLRRSICQFYNILGWHSYSWGDQVRTI